MKANPGGRIPPSEVVGREQLIRRLWRILERQSVVLRAERRMGKTCVIQKMAASPPGGMLILYRDLEGIRSPLEFVKVIFRDVEKHLDAKKRLAEKARAFIGQLAGVEVAGAVKFPAVAERHWKEILARAFEDLMEHQEGVVVFLWDELPLMLFDIKKVLGEEAAMEVLDALRSLRQTHPDLRMVFTGSIGLHNVMTALRAARYANDPTNDMDTVDVPPLDMEHAEELARLLVEGEQLDVGEEGRATSSIAVEVDCIPYYVHHVVDQLAMGGERIDPVAVSELVRTSLVDPDDRWHLRHYRERIDVYYMEADRPLALGLLDVLAVTDETLPFDDVFNRLKSQLPTEDREGILRVLDLLLRDHYILKDEQGLFRFRFSLIRRFWCHHRGLVS